MVNFGGKQKVDLQNFVPEGHPKIPIHTRWFEEIDHSLSQQHRRNTATSAIIWLPL